MSERVTRGQGEGGAGAGGGKTDVEGNRRIAPNQVVSGQWPLCGSIMLDYTIFNVHLCKTV